MNLPPELLTEIFKYIEDDYETLYSCTLVNKQWHNINIPTLWRNSYYSDNSIKILINCILEEDKDSLTRIKLDFELLEKQLLYNYARFCTIIKNYCIFECLIKISGSNPLQILQNKLVNFILDHSTGIREFDTSINCNLLINHHRFDDCFQNLYELDCYDSFNAELFDKLANICKNIQSLTVYMYYDDGDDKSIYNLAQLIKAQKQIKYLTIESADEQILPDELKKAILAHSQSIIFYESSGYGDNLDNLLLPTFKNLKTLQLTSYVDDKIISWKNISLQNIESRKLDYQPFLSELSDFINANGKNLKNLDVGSYDDYEFLRKLFQSIAQSCKNLEDLSITYKDELDWELIEVFNNCIKLKSIKFNNYYLCKIDWDKISTALNETLPKNLKSVTFTCEVYNISNHSLYILMKNWRGPRPLAIKFYKSYNEICPKSDGIKN